MLKNPTRVGGETPNGLRDQGWDKAITVDGEFLLMCTNYHNSY